MAILSTKWSFERSLMFTKEWRYLLLITAIFISACIETDIYLPTFTDMMAYFSISEDKIQSLLTWNFIGICISGPFYGPVSDAIGRKKPLVFALVLFLLGSLITLFAEEFNMMLAGRVLQGVGSGGCFTLGTAIIFDAFKEEKAIQAINRLNSVVPLIMALAPMLGGYLNYAYGFRSNFFAIGVFVLASLLISLFFFEETLSKERRVPLEIREVVKNFKTVSKSLQFWQTTMVVSLVFAGYLAFLSSISVLFVIEYGVSKAMLPFFQVSLLGVWVAASLISKKAIEKLGIPAVKKVGRLLFSFGGVSFILAAVVAPENPYLLTLPMLFYTFGANWVQGLYFPECMGLFPDMKGITASLLTSARLFVTAIIVGVSGWSYDGTIYPVAFLLASVVVMVSMTIIYYEKMRQFEVRRV